MIRERLPALLLATLPALSAKAEAAPPPTEAEPSEPDGRYPIWPSEVDRIAAPLRDPASATESVRVAALEELRQFATPVILPELDLALTDPSPEIRRLALELCTQRRILACVPAAEKMFEDGEGSVRMMALTMLSQDPSEEHIALLYEAMRDPSDLMREQAIMLLVDAPLSAEQEDKARQEIVAQLGDVSARVRRVAARSLGRLGPGDGGLALVRLLDDIDPQVAEAAAVGLGQLEDVRTAPALRRALETPVNPSFAIAAVNALARLPGEDIDTDLLALFDSPPRNLRRSEVAMAIGRRAQPSEKLIAGLVDRIRDSDLRDSAIQSLLWLGDLAVPELEAALARGLEPDIGLEVERLLAARALEPTPREVIATSLEPKRIEPPPKPEDREAWFERLGEREGIDLVPELIRLQPEWLSGALAWQLERGSTPEQVRAWLAVLALTGAPLLDGEDDVVRWGQVASWARDTGLGGEGRCLATLALGSAALGRHAELARTELLALASDALADVRGCAALALARFGDEPVLEGLLADPSARVRAMAALAHRSVRRPSDRVRARLALQADRDHEPQARTSASLVLALPGDDDAGWVLLRALPGSASLFDVSSDDWQRYELRGEIVDVPMFGEGDGIWAIVPLAGARVREEPAAPVLIAPTYPNYYYGRYHY